MRLIVLMTMVAASAVILAALQATTPPYAMLTGPIKTAGRQADTVSSTTFSAQVKQVRTAKSISYAQYGRPIERQTEGVWVVVSADLRAKLETMSIGAATIVGASGRLYRQSRRVDGAPGLFSTKTAQPGLPTTGIFVFELPEAEARSMVLLLSRQYSPQLDDEISIPLDQAGIVPQDRLEIGKNGA
jgi:hypothetical protein